MAVTVTEIWRYPVKSMGGERVAVTELNPRGVHADRMWAVRDPALGAITTARRLPALLKCTARYERDPAGRAAEPGNAPAVIIRFPDGEEASSAESEIHARLSAAVGAEVRLEPLPLLSAKDRPSAAGDEGQPAGEARARGR